MGLNKYYYKDGTISKDYHHYKTLHREDGPAVIYSFGAQYWYINGKLHREDGPAMISASGVKTWYVNGKQHRLNGPAVEFTDSKQDEYWIEGSNMTKEEWEDYKWELFERSVL